MLRSLFDKLFNRNKPQIIASAQGQQIIADFEMDQPQMTIGDLIKQQMQYQEPVQDLGPGWCVDCDNEPQDCVCSEVEEEMCEGCGSPENECSCFYESDNFN